MNTSHLSCVFKLSNVLFEHRLPDLHENVRLIGQGEHQVICLQLALGIDIWLLELIILLEPHVTLQGFSLVGASQLNRFADWSIFFSRSFECLRDSLWHVMIGRRIVKKLTSFRHC